MTSFQFRLAVCLLLASCKPDPRVAETRDELASFATSIKTYRDQKGHWPPSLIEAAGQTCASSRPCVSDKGHLVDRIDPWGNSYEYDQSLRAALVRSSGPDGKLGTKDDLEVSVPGAPPSTK